MCMRYWSATCFSSYLILLLAIPLARPIMLVFLTPDLFRLTLFGLSMISLMAGKHPLRGILVGILGLALGTVGGAASTPEYRYTFDWLYLFGGIPLPVAVAAFFAIPELITFLTSGGKIARTGKLTGGALQGVRSEEHTSELQSLMRISYAVICLKKKK